MPHLSRITIYPIKSLDGVDVTEAVVCPGGSLAHDREFAIFDTDGRAVRGKRAPRLHPLRTDWRPDMTLVEVRVEGQGWPQTFEMTDDLSEFQSFLSGYLGYPVQVRRNVETGFPDDPNLFGPTILASKSLEEVASWFPALGIESVRRRFRANIEIADWPAFEEDCLLAEEGHALQFRIGDVTLEAIAPCDRCSIPSRDPDSGEAMPEFAKLFVEKRQDLLPARAPSSRFPHYFFLSVRTSIREDQVGKVLKVGDELEVLGIKTVRDRPDPRDSFQERHSG